MKKLLSLFLVTVMLITALASCANGTDTPAGTTAATDGATDPATDSTTDPETDPAGDPDPTPSISGTKFALNNTATWVKLLDPRMEATADYITCDWSASGIEFTATFSGDVTFEVNATTKMGGGVEGCNFRAYVDGAIYKNGESDYYEAKGASTIVLKNVPEGTHTVRLVKATGYTLANVELKNVYLTGTVADTAPAAKDLFIEFVGDSISCGWGVVGNYDGAYSSQDATLAYPYLIADALGADYSVVALSGQGIIKGNPGIANGYKYASPFRSKATEYAFTRKANVVVINADTNDAYDNYPAANYIEALGDFVEYVREKNGADTHIILVCNMMKVLYTEAIGDFVKELGGAESKYYVYKATTAAGVHSAHPTAEENVKYAEELGGMINAILEGTYSDEVEAPSIPVNLAPIYTQRFDNVSNVADAGVTHLYGGTSEGLSVADGKLNISKLAWGAKPFIELVSRDTFAGAPGKYMVSVDLDITDLNNLSLVLNGTDDAVADTSYKRKGASIIQLKVRKEGSTSDIKGAPSNFNGGDSWIVIRGGYFKATDGAQTLTDNGAAYARVIEKDATSLKFNLTVVVDSTPTDGCDLLVFVDGAYVTTYHFGNEYDVTANSSIYLWAENTVTTVDNLVVSAIPTIPVNKTPIYTQNFDSVTTAADAGIVNLYGGTMAPTVVDGKLSIPSTAWGDSTPDPFVQLVGREVFSGVPGKYMIEMDVETSKLGVFGLILNGKTDSASDTKYGRENAFLVTLRLGKGVDQLTHGTVAEKAAEYDVWLRTGYFDASKAQKTDIKNDKLVCEIAEGATSVSVKLTIVVNSTLTDGCQVDIYANGVFLYSYTMDNNYDVNANSYISLWAQDAEVKIDNLVVSTVA